MPVTRKLWFADFGADVDRDHATRDYAVSIRL